MPYKKDKRDRNRNDQHENDRNIHDEEDIANIMETG